MNPGAGLHRPVGFQATSPRPLFRRLRLLLWLANLLFSFSKLMILELMVVIVAFLLEHYLSRFCCENGASSNLIFSTPSPLEFAKFLFAIRADGRFPLRFLESVILFVVVPLLPCLVFLPICFFLGLVCHISRALCRFSGLSSRLLTVRLFLWLASF